MKLSDLTAALGAVEYAAEVLLPLGESIATRFAELAADIKARAGVDPTSQQLLADIAAAKASHEAFQAQPLPSGV